jgi:hypothetical protein
LSAQADIAASRNAANIIAAAVGYSQSPRSLARMLSIVAFAIDGVGHCRRLAATREISFLA